MEDNIGIKGYLQIIKRRSWIIFLITFIAIFVSAGVSFFAVNPVYEANTTLLVDINKKPGAEMVTTEQLSVSEKLAVTYGEIIKSKSVLNEVEDSLDLNCGYEELSDKVNVSSINKTQIISVSVQDTNPKRATDIANAIPTAFQQEVKRITQANDVKVIDKAVVPNKPIKPNKATIIAISAILGIMISLFIIFLLEYIRPKEGVKKNDK
ncbi:Wzz/FepE/Etk N-terminal domain-containing protein [Paraclostridium bifermentans]|uniref:YveK family protein n=1 Tax=Paraclostridium bifermentans TaxID=1490 RepID=UPI001FF4F7AD|nr:Wzz/FepE/Etk N-terminal domain-containing protein [Paraclostridium bifermentans]MCR1876277.1 Wzz/FepE/Etk N-terminal domain-containing protein [Paraclostridium bifermentans]UOW67226.1 Wzz/FepE/Etk N-terminal domain-containing protein [Paraclostridium bifermentans]